MSYAGLGTQAAAFEEPPKDPPTSPSVPVVPLTPGLYTTPTQQTSSQTPLAPLAPMTPYSGAQGNGPVSDWRRQIQRMLESATVMIMSLPGDVIAALMAFFAGLSPAIRQEGDEFTRWLGDPNKTDAQVAEKLNTVKERYRALRPSLPSPAVRLLDPIVDGAIALVPASIQPPGMTAPISGSDVPWLWVAGSFVAGMIACSFISKPKTTPNRRRRVRRNRRRR